MTRWQIAEAPSFANAVADLASAEWVDWALAPIIYALHRNPLGFPLVPGYATLRLARTTLRIEKSEIFPNLHLWFRTDEETRTVFLLWGEISPADELALTSDFWDTPDDEILL